MNNLKQIHASSSYSRNQNIQLEMEIKKESSWESLEWQQMIYSMEEEKSIGRR